MSLLLALTGGGGVDVTVNITGVSASGSVGVLTVTGDANVTPVGQSSTGSIGTVTVTGDSNYTLTGQFATGAVGDVTVTTNIDVNVFVTGVYATGVIGDVTVTTGGNPPIVGAGWMGNDKKKHREMKRNEDSVEFQGRVESILLAFIHTQE